MKDYEGAANAQRKAIAAKPDFAEAHGNLGNALHALRRFDEAIPAYRRAIAINPNYADGWANLGTTLHPRQLEEGISALRRAIALAPHHANARSGLGILLLLRGDLGEGWDEYEWRLRSTERKGPKFPENPWQGENLAGKHIYVQAEQGFGDTLQFARYMPLLLARGAKVTLRVHQQLVGLMRESLPGVVVLGDRGDPAPYQCDAVLLRLPRVFQDAAENIPAEVPYLRAPADAATALEHAACKNERLTSIGIVWAGERFMSTTPPFARFIDVAPLFAVGDDIHKPAIRTARGRSEKIETQNADRGSEQACSWTFRYRAAVDRSTWSSPSTLGRACRRRAGQGGLGDAAVGADWRWLLDREDNPWYPTARLFRQRKGRGPSRRYRPHHATS